MGCSGDREKGELDESQKWTYVVSVVLVREQFWTLANVTLHRRFPTSTGLELLPMFHMPGYGYWP